MPPPSSTAPTGLDVEAGLRLWRNANTYRTYLRQYVEDYSPQINAILSLNERALDALLHKLTGAAGNLCLPQVQRTAKAFQEVRRAGQDPHAADTACAALVAAHAEATQSIHRYLLDNA